ncbi:MAG: PAS domain S-box protein, partial [Elainellaceae cyanobacterium]
MIPLERVIQPCSLIVPVETPIQQVIQSMNIEQLSYVLVTNREQISGIFTDRDLVRVVAKGYSSDRPIGEVATPTLVTLTLESDESSDIDPSCILQRMHNNHVQHVLVLNADHEIQGIITELDLRRSLNPLEMQIAVERLHQKLDESTAQLKREIAQRLAAEQKYAKIFQASPDAISIVRESDRRYLEVNDSHLAITGYGAEDIVGHTIEDLNIGIDPAEVDQIRHQFEETGTLKNQEICWRTRTGEIKTLLFSSERIEIDGEPCVLSISKDISDRKRIEAEHQHANQHNRFQAHLLSQVNDAIIAVDRTHRVMYWNHAAEQLYGIAADDAMGKPLSDCYEYSWFSDSDHQAASEALDQTGSWHGENIHRMRNGHEVFVESSVNVLHDENRNPTGFVAVIRDVTRRKRVEAALHESEARFLQIAENIHDSFFLKAIGTGEMIYINSAIEETYQSSRQWLYDNPYNWLEFVHPGDRSRVLTAFQKQINGEEFGDLEYRVIQPGGLLRWIWCRTFPIFNEAGEIYRFAGVNRDITDRKQTEIELQSMRDRLYFLLTTTPAVIYSAQADSTYTTTSISENIKALTGYDAHLFIETPSFWIDHLHPDDAKRFSTQLSEAFEDDVSTVYEYRFRCADGTYIWMQDSFRLIRDSEGNPVELVGYFIDVTAHKQLELALEASEAKLQDILNSATALINRFRVLPDGTWTCEYVSAGVEIVFGYTVEEFEANPYLWRSLVVSDDLSSLFLLENVDRELVVEREYRFYHKDGRLRWATNYFRSRRDESSGGWIVTIVDIDITDRKQAELALQTSEKRWRAFLNTIPDLITLVNDQGIHVESISHNPNMDIVPSDVVKKGKHLTELLPPEIAEKRIDAIREALRTREVQIYEQQLWNRRRLQYEEIRVAPVDDHTVLCIMRDVTERRLTEIALQESEERFRALVENSSDIIWEEDEHFIFTYVCPNVQTVLGYTADEIIGRSAIDFLLPSEIARIIVEDSEHQPVRLREVVFLHKEGHPVVIETSAIPFFDADGQFKGYRGIDRDITVRKQTEAALRDSEARNRAIVSAIPDLMFRVSAEGVYLGYVRSSQVHDLIADDINPVGQSIANLVPQDILQQHEYYRQRALEMGELQTYEQKVQIHGSFYYEEVRMVASGRDEVLCIIRDISDRKHAEKALREGELLFRSLFEQAAVGIVFCTPTGYLIRCNEKYCQITGYPEAELFTKRFQDLTAPEFLDKNLGYLEQLLENKVPSVEFEKQYLRKDGTRIWVNITMTLIHDFLNVPELVAAVVQDISDRKLMELTIRENEARNRAFLATIPDLIVLIDFDGIFLEEISKHPGDVVPRHVPKVGRHLSELLPADMAARQFRAVRNAITTQQVQVYEQEVWNNHRLQYEEVRVAAVNGHTAMVIIQDITSNKLAEIALRESEERFRRTFEDAAVGMAMVGLDGRMLRVNQAICDFLGYSQSDLLCKVVENFTHPDDIGIEYDSLNQLLDGSIPYYHIEKRYIHEQGHTIWGLLSVSLIRDTYGQPAYVVGIVQDISDRKAIDRIKEEFISVVSHELRTPLTAIHGSLGLLNTGIYDNNPVKKKHMIDIAALDTERLVRLVNDILDLERLGSGQTEFVVQPCAIADLLWQAVESMQLLADQANIQLVVQPVSATVWVDSDAILQTLTNLISNAIKFSPPQSVVTVSAEKLETSIQVQVSDRGRGIPADKLESIFGRFQQVDASDSRRRG